MKTFSKNQLSALGLSACNIKKMAEKHFANVSQDIPYDLVIVPGTPIGDTAMNSILMARCYSQNI
jgi:hypothetical protein